MELYRDATGSLEARLAPTFPFTVGWREGQGRCLLAAREIRPQQTILTDSAILLGELFATKSSSRSGQLRCFSR